MGKLNWIHTTDSGGGGGQTMLRLEHICVVELDGTKIRKIPLMNFLVMQHFMYDSSFSMDDSLFQQPVGSFISILHVTSQYHHQQNQNTSLYITTLLP